MTDDIFANRRFLIADDEPFVRRVVVRYLTNAGAASVTEAADGREAIAAIAAADITFDALVTDLNMRPMNGLALLKAIRTGADGLKRNLPVVMLTAHAEAAYVAQALALDADSFVIKPVGKDDLLSRLARICERRSPLRGVAEYEAVSLDDRFYGARVAEAASVRATPVPAAAVRRVPLETIEPNAVLGDDVFGRDGAIYLTAGTVLSATLLARLRDLRELNDVLHVLPVRDPRR